VPAAFDELPESLLALVFAELPLRCLRRAGQCCVSWNKTSTSSAPLWQRRSRAEDVGSQLIETAKVGDTAALAQLLEGVRSHGRHDIDSVVFDPTTARLLFLCTPLCAAACHGQVEATKMLLDHGANPSTHAGTPDDTGFTPLILAMSPIKSGDCLETIPGNLALVQELVSRGADLEAANQGDGAFGGWTAFHYACMHDNADYVEVLVRAGCNTAKTNANGYTGLRLAEVLDKPAAAGRYRQLMAQHSELMDATKAGDVGAMAQLLDGGASPDVVVTGRPLSEREHPDSTALCVAASNGHFAAAMLLLERGASPNQPTGGCGEAATTPLVLALSIPGNLALVQELVSRGAELEAASKGDTTLRGWTAFHYACLHDDADYVEVLVRAGCNTAKANANGYTGLRLAEVLDKPAAAERLRQLLV
jgi:ankyrin repeat protein